MGRVIADKHAVSISAVALRWVIQQEAVGSAIMGMRVGETAANHIDENRLVFSFELDPDDMKHIATIQAKGRPLYDVLGDCGVESKLVELLNTIWWLVRHGGTLR